MNPYLTQSIKGGPHEVVDIVTSLDLHSESTFSQVFDAPALLVEGGDHWSLPTFVPNLRKLHHFDNNLQPRPC